MEENKYGYLYVLEFSYPGIYEIELTEEDQTFTSDEILEKYGLKEDNCHFMYTENKLELLTLNE
uniref:Uncharacterized protein n=1 Tax=Geladintestivirus 5 TaxID=3233137 RepID=A0AAU8MKH6_9CAUD